MLFSAYRATDFADADGFAVQLATVLSEFPEEVVLYVTGPTTGLQRRSKWPPTISEVLAACEDHQTYLARVRERQQAKPKLPSPSNLGAPGSLANLFVPESHPKYPRLLEWAQLASPVLYRAGKSSDGRNGMWVAYNKWVDGLPGEGRAEAAE